MRQASRGGLRPRHSSIAILVASMLLLTGCPERVSWTDSRVVPLLQALKGVNRAALGFTPIEPSAKVRLERAKGRTYDAMLHVEGGTSRTIAFARSGREYVWIGEQEIHEGPATFDTPDGRIHEHIAITFETVPISGAPLNTVYVSYWGEDPRLSGRPSLTLADVAPVLEQWASSRK